MLEASVGLDPSYAPAWAALAGRYINARVNLRDETMLDKAEAAARKALEINPQTALRFLLAGGLLRREGRSEERAGHLQTTAPGRAEQRVRLSGDGTCL